MKDATRTAPVSRNGRPRAMLAICVFVLGVAVFLGMRAESTEAAWTRPQNATGSMSAMTVPKPITTSCTASSVLVGLSLTPRLVVRWVPAAGYLSTAAEYSYSTSGGLVNIPLGSGVTTTGPIAGVYTSTFNGGALGGLLGGQADAAISTTHTSGWASAPSTVHATFPLLLGDGTCTITSSG
jgi:hypothetical protein